MATSHLACSSKKIAGNKHNSTTKQVALLATVLVTTCRSPSPIGNPNEDGMTSQAPLIAPPAGDPNKKRSGEDANGGAIEKLLSEMPEESKGSNSEIIMPADAAGVPRPDSAQGASEQRRREFSARRTDNEIVGAARSVEERHGKDLGFIDRQLGLEPSEKPGQPVSFVLNVQRIKSLFKERQYEQALIETNELLRHYPKSSQLLQMKGTLHQRLGQIELALTAYERAFEFEPSHKLDAQIAYLRGLLSERAELARRARAVPISSSPEGGK